MRNIIYYITSLVAAVCMFTSCKKESEEFLIQEGTFKGSLSAASTVVLLLPANENAVALSFTWGAADFGEKPAVKYTLQLDLPSDTIGTNAWGNAKNFVAGNNILSYEFIVKDLNSTLNIMGLAAGVRNDIVFRVKAEVPQYNGATSSIPPIYSHSVSVKITSYSLSLYIPGDYQGWNPGVAPLLNPVEGRPGMYEGFIYMPGAGPQYFKYTSAPDWNHINYGDGGNGTFSTNGLAGGLYSGGGGYYEVTADFNTNHWTTTKTTWAIIGDATPGGWGNDTQMTYDPVNQVWKLTCAMLSNGSFKFRANNAWSIDFGIDPVSQKLIYADNPFLGYTPGLWNLSVPVSGNYIITLNLHDSQHYTYSLVKI